MRSLDLKNFLLFEQEIKPLENNYTWELNARGNLIARDTQGAHCFTWQPHGSQLTQITPIPPNALKFSLKSPPPLECTTLLKHIGFKRDWVRIFEGTL